MVVVTTPPENDTRHLAIELEVNYWYRMLTNLTFEYRSNPVIMDILPRSHLAV